MHYLRFRQVHLDFHTSPDIAGIGAAFEKKGFQETLRRGHVNSITLFSKCHHGWTYHSTVIGKMHPHLGFDLLRAQFDACKEIDVNAPVYLSAGYDEVAAAAHPDWREMDATGKLSGSGPLDPGYHKLCFHSPYLDYLCAQIREAARLFPNCDGIFLDIINQGPCCCPYCLAVMAKNGLDPRQETDRRKCAELAVERYYRDTTAAARCDNPAMPVFHNSGHITPGRRDSLPYFSHLELESLPTGGWGYDHYPMSAKYAAQLGLDFLGMTGKFHSTWGEFGGFKHPNALRYECAAMLAFGSKCSVGDQLHPGGALDPSTYDIIGAAYAEVERKEPWCDRVENVADVGLLLSGAVSGRREPAADTGAARILLEGHFLFDVLDLDVDFNRYKVLVLPDDVAVGPELKARLDAYLKQGGRLFLTGASGAAADGRSFLFDIGAEYAGPSPFQPDYVLPRLDLRAEFVRSPMVMYRGSHRIRVTDGESLGAVHDPYFNRGFNRFCSHQHTPNRPEASGFDCGVRKGGIVYLAHPVFGTYRDWGAVACREYAVKALRLLLGETATLQVNLPSTGRVTLMRQPAEKRQVLHLLHATMSTRGGNGVFFGSPHHFEVIEELLPLRGTDVTLRPPQPVTRATLEPQGAELPLTRNADGSVSLRVEEFTCHQMVVLHES